MQLKIALAGNPNSGKTTMFNDLTGSAQHVGNWPGVTVEKKEGKLKSDREVTIQDLPGIYSLSPYTLEEVVSRNYLIKEKPDAMINIVDGTNIERNLYLTTQLAEIGVPMVLALNMIDVVNRNGDKIDTKKLGEMLGCEVIETSAIKRIGSREVAEKAVQLGSRKEGFTPRHTFSEELESALAGIAGLVEGKIPGNNVRWYSIKLFERDKEVLKDLKLDEPTSRQIEEIITELEEKMDDDSESIVTSERYEYIATVIQKCVKHKNRGALSTSDKIDQVVTNRVAALPIFAVVMFLVYYISISTIGTMATDFVNDGFFGDGFFWGGSGREEYDEAVGEFDLEQVKIEAYIEAAEGSGIDVAAVTVALEAEEPTAGDEAALEAFTAEAAAANLTADAEIYSEEGDLEEVVPVTAEDFAAALAVEEPDPADFGPWCNSLPVAVDNGLSNLETADWLQSLVIDGIIGGVGAVLGFLPQMLVLFILLAILEDCGYMARIAFIMDRIFRRFGLSGKSFIPMLVSIGCGVPGVMASRTIENDKDRRMTVMTTTFIPCGAKLPIIALIAGALFPGSTWVAPSAYFLGIAAIIVSGIMLKKTKMFAGDPAPFVMELPSYHAPRPASVLRSMAERGLAFVKKAGTIVLLSTILIWFLSSFNTSMEMVETGDSMLAVVGSAIAPIFAPLGWGRWEFAVGSITGLIAKENVVGTMGVLFGLGEVAENGWEFWPQLQAAIATPLAAYSFLTFNLLCCPCFAAIGAIRREMMSAKWTWFAIGYQCIFAYVISLIIYQMGKLFGGGGFGVGTVFGFAFIVLIIYLLFRKPYQPDRTIKTQTPQSAVR